LEKQREKIFKLAVPLRWEIQRTAQAVYLSIEDRYGNTMVLENARSIEEGEVDSDGFVRFSVIESSEVEKPKQLMEMPQSQAHVNGYSLFHTNLSRSFGYGGQKSIFEYYKRDSDLSYYAIIKKEGKPDRKVLLGSLQDQTSRIFQIACIIHKNFVRDKAFDKLELTHHLPSSFGARIMKATLDILAKEGYLIAENTMSAKRNRPKEAFIKTEKLEKYFADPRSWQKTNGFNIGSLAVTSDQ
jgi:hypothetical protein